jgi:hypothetical protein
VPTTTTNAALSQRLRCHRSWLRLARYADQRSSHATERL